MADKEPCYHCGLPIPASVDFSVEIDGQRRAMCCAGCQAVAQAIVANGLTDYYRHRDAMPESPREALPQVLATSPANVDALFLLGQIYKAAGFEARASAMFRRVLELKPRHAGALEETGTSRSRPV